MTCVWGTDLSGSRQSTGGVGGLVTVCEAGTSKLRACLKTLRGAVFAQQARRRGATKENIPGGSSTEEQRSQRACCAKTLRAAGLSAMGCVGSVLTAPCGDARTSPPCPWPKSLAAAPLTIFRQALRAMLANSRKIPNFMFPPDSSSPVVAPGASAQDQGRSRNNRQS